WVGGGSFFNCALDLAGYRDVVSRHNRFYARVQRKEFSPWSVVYSMKCPADPAARHYPDCVPPGTFEMNYFADPTEVVPGAPFSFEIDEAGLGVWTMWDHAQYLTDAAERAAYLADVCPAMERGAANLAACRDPPRTSRAGDPRGSYGRPASPPPTIRARSPTRSTCRRRSSIRSSPAPPGAGPTTPSRS